ncbi:response regulator [Sphaerotilus sp.]|jgi:DNA-binding NarL/FixJ family response regulator|uniref:response regulator n=1 Tax=Sphaerotilus sp. TaxID=2093942 RepID=UPI0025DC2AAB|nr:response regulator transcription factor [Sphaerotilus sp.]
MKVLLIDDHPLILSAMQSVILGLGANVEALGVETAAECRALLRQDSDFDLVLLDLHLDDASGFDVLDELRMGYPALPVVVVSASDRASDVIRAIDSGAMGFVPKRASNELLFEALHLVMSGGIYVPPMTPSLGDSALSTGLSGAGAGVGPLMPGSLGASVEDDRLAFGGHRAAGRRVGEVAERDAALDRLGMTPRQREVLALLLDGKSNKMIARDLAISVETVKDHVAAVLRTLGVNSRTQAVLAVGRLHAPAGSDTRGTGLRGMVLR